MISGLIAFIVLLPFFDIPALGGSITTVFGFNLTGLISDSEREKNFRFAHLFNAAFI